MGIKKLKFSLPIIGIIILALLSGCATKGYVDKAIADERSKREAAVDGISGGIDANKSEIAKLKSLTSKLEGDVATALEEAKGFENYQVIWQGEIFFEFNSSEISAEAQAILDQGGDKMITNRTSFMEIAGYCDPTGTAKANLILGNRRAAAAKYYLVDNYGINLYRTFMVSFGKNKSVAGDDRSSYAKQRKVTLKLWGKP